MVKVVKTINNKTTITTTLLSVVISTKEKTKKEVVVRERVLQVANVRGGASRWGIGGKGKEKVVLPRVSWRRLNRES